ncbi:MAG: huntington interacting protein HYPE [Desulfobacterales bacterium]|nr:MAG: huntington interacting protein HYPE [Desulfobacterales bacterium]
MGRLWQTLVLSADTPVFAWLPIETMVYQHQTDYYATLAQADTENDSTVFIEFILSVILQTIEDYSLTQKSDNLSDIMSDTLSDKEQLAYRKISHYLQQHTHITNQQAQNILEKSPATVRRYFKRLVDCGLLIATGKNKARVYRLATQNRHE